METRRLRLSVVAHLRGLLDPYYEHGNRSLIKENIILKAISDELAAGALETSALIDSSIVSIHKNATGLYSTMYDKVNDVKAMREFNHKILSKKSESKFLQSKEMNKSGKLTSQQEEFVELYKVLSKAGVMKKLEESIKR